MVRVIDKGITPKYWQKACKYLSDKDPVMAHIIKSHPEGSLICYLDPFKTLANAIVGQQISVAAADAIWARFQKLFPRKKISAKNYLELSEEKLRGIGFSRQKFQYLGNIARYFIENKVTNKYFEEKPSQEIADGLLAIKGVGPWTLEMFQIFYLNEPDIFSPGDIGLIRAIKDNYTKKRFKDKEAIVEFTKTWAPYRTVASWYLWRTIDEEPVQY